MPRFPLSAPCLTARLRIALLAAVSAIAIHGPAFAVGTIVLAGGGPEGNIGHTGSWSYPLYKRLLRLLGAGALAATTSFAIAATVPGASKPARVPAAARFQVAEGRERVLSHPAYLSSSVEGTPYQLMQTCDPQDRACKTLLDLRGGGAGVSVPASRKPGFSPDQRYLLCLRLSGVDGPHKTYRGQEYEIYDLRSGEAVDFATVDGTSATTDNILGWSASEPHALEISADVRKSVLALPPR